MENASARARETAWKKRIERPSRGKSTVANKSECGKVKLGGFSVNSVKGIAAVGLFLLGSVLLASSNRESAKVSGALFDEAGARIPNAKLIFERNSQREVLTSAEGTYEVELPAGIYSLRAHPRGFCPLRRSRVDLRRHAHLDVVLSTCGISDKFRIPGASAGTEFGQTEPAWRFQSFAIAPRNSPKLVIQYLRKNVGVREILFDTAMDEKLQAEKASVILTYDVWTVVANKLHLDRTAMEFCAEEATVYSPQGTLERQAVILKAQNKELAVGADVQRCR